MALTQEEVRKIAKLSRINLEDTEIEHFQQELSQILDWVQQLQEVDTNNIAQTASPTTCELPLREDKKSDGNYAEDILKNAPESNYGCFIVPKVVE